MDKLISFDELGRLLENFSDHFKGSTVQNDDLQYIISYIPVSYTHLDVYKRQAMNQV